MAAEREAPDPRALLVDSRAPFGSGLGRYMRELVRALLDRDDFREIVLAGDAEALEPFLATLKRRPRVVPLPHARYAWQVPLQWDAVRQAVGVPHVTWFPHWDGAWSATPCATTLHDLIAFEGQGPKAAARRAVARTWMGRMIAASGALLTGSEGSAARIREEFTDAAAKLHVVPHGVAEVFLARGHRGGPMRAIPEARTALALPAGARYLLTVANKKPHKRLETAIQAFASLAAQDPQLHLVMVGERFPHLKTLRALALLLGVADRVHDVAGVTDEALADIYAGAEALLIGSREEGFGMVALEAMACGTPVVTVDSAPLPEVVGDAGIVVPFDDARAMENAVASLTNDTGARAVRVRRGLERAATFTWANAAARTAALLRALR
ncbi:MAG: glycosyltransferase family 4 protein [Gemmatimonadaceae bacterium]|nr:glycosyltransferase family 4 protein [Gemmatimonadaceae bacterium]